MGLGMENEQATWIAAEMTGYSTRLWSVDSSGDILRKAELPALEAAALAAAAISFAETDTCALVTCGVQRDGFRSLPARPLSESLTASALGPFTRIGIAGLSQGNPAAVTRGAETRIAGFLELNPDYDGVLCLTDHETTWAHISAGEVVSMQVFASCVLAQRFLGKNEDHFANSEGDAFEEALSDTLSKPERMAARIASARAESLLQDADSDLLRGRVWGALLGAELSAARPYWLGQQVAVVGESKLAGLYTSAMRKQGLSPIQADGDAMLLRGFALAWGRCKS